MYLSLRFLLIIVKMNRGLAVLLLVTVSGLMIKEKIAPGVQHNVVPREDLGTDITTWKFTSFPEIGETFDYMVKFGNDYITATDLEMYWRWHRIPYASGDADKVIQTMDVSMDDKVDLDEFLAYNEGNVKRR